MSHGMFYKTFDILKLVVGAAAGVAADYMVTDICQHLYLESLAVKKYDPKNPHAHKKLTFLETMTGSLGSSAMGLLAGSLAASATEAAIGDIEEMAAQVIYRLNFSDEEDIPEEAESEEE